MEETVRSLPAAASRFVSKLCKSSKTRVDFLFVAHAVVAGIVGTFAVLLPHVFEWFMIHHGEGLALRDNSSAEGKITHLVVRMYGALILAQSWIVLAARKVEEGSIRRALIQAYFGCFLITTLALLRAQLTEGGSMSSLNWLNILLFFALTVSYGWFAFVEKVTIFEGLGRAAK